MIFHYNFLSGLDACIAKYTQISLDYNENCICNFFQIKYSKITLSNIQERKKIRIIIVDFQNYARSNNKKIFIFLYSNMRN
jgi:hypothetical protein